MLCDCVGGGSGEKMTRHITSVLHAERRRPVHKQESAVQCEKCMRWFCSRGGLTVHRCRRKEVVEDGAAAGVGVSQG